MKYKIIISIAFIIGSFSFLFGQIPTAPPTYFSPNTVGIAAYGNYPVSYYTGLPKIEVPIFDLQSGSLDLPISLGYHASGFRPDQHPGWVGSGWNLFAGGVITRQINDLPDDFNNSNFYQGANAGYYFNHNILNNANWNVVSNMVNIAHSDASFKDTEPDEFSFRLPDGQTGKFYMSEAGVWKVRSNRAITISFDNSFVNVPFNPPSGSPYNTYGYFKSFSGFTLTDDNGIKYVFGGGTSAIEYSMPFFAQNESHWNATSWYLTEIIHPMGDTIFLSYSRGSFINQMYSSIYDRISSSTSGSSFYSCSFYDYTSIGASYQGQLISPVYLTTITSGNRKIDFITSTSSQLRYPETAYSFQYAQWLAYASSTYPSFLPFLEGTGGNTYPNCLNTLQWPKLDQIKISVNNIVQKSFNFAYNNSSTDRLFLQSITELGKNDGALKPYSFTYNTSVSLPPYLANKNDHWGFYNGTYADISNLSTYYLTYYDYRNPNTTYLQAGTISRISYPTGGVTDFTFEPHSYRKVVPVLRSNSPEILTQNTLGGGLRIRKISSYDPNFPDQKKDKEFFYVDGYTHSANVSSLQSSGILGGKIQYYFDNYVVTSFNDNLTLTAKIFSSQSLLPSIVNDQGCHIDYSTVIEKKNDNSYIRYQFSNYDNASYRDVEPDAITYTNHMAYEPVVSKELTRGKELQEDLFNSTDVLMDSKTFTYIALNNSNEIVRSLKASYYSICPGTPVSTEIAIAYNFLTYAFLPTFVRETKYDQNGVNPKISQINYGYDANYKTVKSTSFTDSKGQVTAAYFRYAYDVSTGSSSPVTNPSLFPVLWMKQNNVIGQPLEKVSTVLKAGVEQVISVEVNTLDGTSSTPLTAFPKAQYLLNSTQPFPRSGYVPYSVNSASSGEPVTMDSRLKLVNEYTYKIYSPSIGQYYLRLFENRPYRAPINSFLWGYGQRLPIGETKNTEGIEPAYSSFESTDKGNWTYSGSTITDATAPTGKYVYNLSEGSISRAGLTSTKKYLLTYWAKSASATAISGGTATVLRTYNGWTQYSRVITGITSLTISGTVPVDEVRLYNFEGSQNTYTYNELGAITTETDGKGYTKYYTYDEFNRLVTVKDNDSHLLEDYTYHLR